MREDYDHTTFGPPSRMPIHERLWSDPRFRGLAVFGDFTYPLYRYAQIEHFEHFMKTGIIRLSVLSGYRDTAKLGKVIGDESEGYIWYQSGISADIANLELPVSMWADSVNQWAYCCSEELSARLFKCFGASVCFEIISEEFFLEICAAAAATQRVCVAHLTSADYRNVEEVVEEFMGHVEAGTTCPAPRLTHLKPRHLSYQKEVRLLLEPWSPIPSTSDPTFDHQPAVIAGNPEANLQRPRLFPNLRYLEVHAPNARKHVRRLPNPI